MGVGSQDTEQAGVRSKAKGVYRDCPEVQLQYNGRMDTSTKFANARCGRLMLNSLRNFIHTITSFVSQPQLLFTYNYYQRMDG